MNSFSGYVGGKKALRNKIIDKFTCEFDRYIEVFGGAGWVLLHKDRHAPFEVYNDINSELVNLFRCVKAHPGEPLRELDWSIISRQLFNDRLGAIENLTDIQRAYRFLYLLKYSFCGKMTTFGANNRPMPSPEYFRELHTRLEKVIIENKPFESVIKQYDRASALFYLDPPYYGAEKYYNVNEVNFTADDHVKLRDILTGINGRFVLSYNDSEYIRGLYKDFNICEATRGSNFQVHRGTRPLYYELIISNY